MIGAFEPAAIGLNEGRKVMYSMDGYLPMQFGRTYVVFLQKSGVKGFWSIVNMNLSRFPVDGGTLQGVYHDEKEFQVAKSILKEMRITGFYP